MEYLPIIESVRKTAMAADGLRGRKEGSVLAAGRVIRLPSNPKGKTIYGGGGETGKKKKGTTSVRTRRRKDERGVNFFIKIRRFLRDLERDSYSSARQ